MRADHALIYRSGDLKSELVDFALSKRYRRDLERFLNTSFGGVMPDNDKETYDTVDRFILQERQRDGRTVVEHFLAAHPELPTVERDLLHGWSDVVEGYYRVEQVHDDHIVAFNLLDELSYDVYSNVGPGMFSSFSADMYLYMRIVPAGEVWITSGTMRTYAAR